MRHPRARKMASKVTAEKRPQRAYVIKIQSQDLQNTITKSWTLIKTFTSLIGAENGT